MRVLFAPLGSRGDVQPMAALAHALRDHGHVPSFCATLDFHAALERDGFKVHPIGVDVQQTALGLGDAVRRPKVFLTAIGELMHRCVAPLQQACAGADVVVGGGAQGVAPMVCEQLGVPYHFAAYCPTLVPSRHHAPVTIPWQRMPRWGNALLWSMQELIFGAALRGPVGRLRRDLGLPATGDGYEAVLGKLPVLGAFDAELVHAVPDWSGRVAVTGNWVLPQHGALDPCLEDFISAGPPPVYVGFGSMPHSDPARSTREVLEGIRLAGVRALISAGWAGLGKEVDMPPGCRPIADVPHAVLFPRLAAVVHHGGAGTTATAARAGVPQVVVPHLMDQFYWAERVRTLGVGPAPLPVSKLRAGSLAAALRRAVDDDCRTRARDLAERLRGSTGTRRAIDFLVAAHGKSVSKVDSDCVPA